MKVKVSYTVEVDPAKWRAEYDLCPSTTAREVADDIRDTIRDYSETATRDWLAQLELTPGK